MNNDRLFIHLLLFCKKMVPQKRFERPTHSLEGCCSIQLSYGTIRKNRTANISVFFE